MIKLKEVVDFLDNYLSIKKFKDESWNGLQVEGKQEINKIVFAVDAGMQTFKKAAEENADMIVTHHGMFWAKINPSVVGYNKKRIEFLLKNNISHYGVHLPLDAHPESGNNAQLIKTLGFEIDKDFAEYGGQSISFTGKTQKPKSIEEIVKILEKELSATCKVLPFGKKEIKTIGVCSGGGGYPQFMQAVELGLDLYLTGDSTEMYQMVKDIGMNVVFAGHHATEIVGVKDLAKVVKEKLGVETLFIDIPTGL